MTLARKQSSMLYMKGIRPIIARRGKAIGNHRITYEGEKTSSNGGCPTVLVTGTELEKLIGRPSHRRGRHNRYQAIKAGH